MTKNLTFFQIILAFLLPSIFAFLGFRLVLPSLVSNGYPIVLMWGIVAIIMLFVLVLIGFLLNKYDSRKLNISLTERLCIKKISGKQWLICFGIMIIGLILSMTVKPLVEPITGIPGFSIPDYMPFWLNPSIDVVNTSQDILSPGYPLKGNFTLLVLMAFALILNILAEEIYFRAWLLPKMQKLGKWSWVLNGLFFALYHSFQLWLFPMLLVASLTSTYVVYRTKSIIPGFVFHFIANFLLAIIGIMYLVLN